MEPSISEPNLNDILEARLAKLEEEFHLYKTEGLSKIVDLTAMKVSSNIESYFTKISRLQKEFYELRNSYE